ncbi:thrombospondin type 3 repeat-containing protein [Vibrio sp. YMD68]|uniref:thrombospondin type 3 repeat-containing protein n=1 Tax=Vibrio sp. YMD68 TaxID=3042300 RepID=UPI00249B6E4F|nr:thrombospondin type 3 repeat-containing protein [Vibrio sp. YMD68]WGV98267.1 thrombospondin type 3 repeat-containing protein [Vibrio sp. YMD68]
MMRITNKQRMKLVAPLMAALLLSACGGDDTKGLPSQGNLSSDAQGQVCESIGGVSARCDSDKDGISDDDERAAGTNPNDPNDPVENGDKDDDGDGIKNGKEVVDGSNPNDPDDPVENGDKDDDGDGIKNGKEVVDGSNPNDPNDPVENGDKDDDGDGIKNGKEEVEGWDKNNPNDPVENGDKDDDGDGIKNGKEVVDGTAPNNPNDPVPNGAEDKDKDGIPNGLETVEGWDDNDPNNPVPNGGGDDDGDGIKNGKEVVDGTNPNNANDPVPNGAEDKDGDGLPNGLETVEGWDDNDPDNPVENGSGDDDGDGITNAREWHEGWGPNDPNSPVENGDADNDADGFKAGKEWLEGWNDNDPNNPIAADNVQNPTLTLDNTTVTPGMGLQARIEFTVQGESGTFSTLEAPDANHVTWQVLDGNDSPVAGLTPTSEGHVTIPDSKTALPFADEPLTMQAIFVEGGWFDGQPSQEQTFTVTLADVSSSKVALLKDGAPLEGSEINVGDTITGQTTVQLADGSSIVVPADASLGTWSVDQAATDLGVTIDPVTGELDTSGVDNNALGEEGVSITLSWTGVGSLAGGEDDLRVTLNADEGIAFINDSLSVGPIVTEAMYIEGGGDGSGNVKMINGYVYTNGETAATYCQNIGGGMMDGVERDAFGAWLNDGFREQYQGKVYGTYNVDYDNVENTIYQYVMVGLSSPTEIHSVSRSREWGAGTLTTRFWYPFVCTM